MINLRVSLLELNRICLPPCVIQIPALPLKILVEYSDLLDPYLVLHCGYLPLPYSPTPATNALVLN